VDFSFLRKIFPLEKLRSQIKKSTALTSFPKILLNFPWDTHREISHPNAEALAFMSIQKKNEFIEDKRAPGYSRKFLG
jgi:hypothetical protein